MSHTKPVFMLQTPETPAEAAISKLLDLRSVVLDEVTYTGDKLEHSGTEPGIQYPAHSINIGTTVETNILNGGNFDDIFDVDMEPTAEVSRMLPKGEAHIEALYCYRSISKSIPPNANQRAIPKGASEELMQEINAKNEDANERIIDMLRPEIMKLRDVMVYVGSFLLNLKGLIAHMLSSELNGKIIPDEVLWTVLKGIDVLLRIDYLKDSKSCFKHDFLRYKGAVAIQSRKLSVADNSEMVEELTQMQIFLSHPDPRKSRHYIHLSMKEEIRSLIGHEPLMLELIDFCIRCLDNRMYLLPHEVFRILRVLPHLMLFADGNGDYRTLNIFKDKRATTLRNLLVKNPVVPVCRDLTVRVISILEMSANFDRLDMANEWGDLVPDAIIAQHNVSAQWTLIKERFEDYMPRLLVMLHNVESVPFEKTLDSITVDRCRLAYDIVLEGVRLVGDWNCVVQRAMAWKYTHPAPLEHLQAVHANMALETFEYESLVKFNFTKMELSTFADLVANIKSVAGMLDKSKAIFAPMIRFHIHHEVQQLVQGDLLPIIHRMSKRKKKSLESMLKLRLLGADWNDDEEPIDDYKAYSRKMGSISATHPARVVAPHFTQLQFIRWQIFAISHPASEARRGSGGIIAGKPDLEQEDIETLERFYKSSFFYPYMLDISGTLREVSNLSYLWFRETFLENARCTQFAVETSLPYMLTERALHSRSETTSHLSHDNILPLIEVIFYTMDIYNDVAADALNVLNQQYMFDEVEAEANLIFDTFTQTLATDIFSHYKNLAAYTKMDKTFKDKLVLNGELQFNTNKSRFEIPVMQRSVQLMGRTVDLRFLIKQHVNNLLLHDIEHAFTRFEHAGIAGLTEFTMVIDVIQETHTLLAEILELDPFLHIFQEYNETFEATAKRGFITSLVVKCLVEDLFPNYSYNMFTERFVRSPVVLKPMKPVASLPAFSSSHFGFGTLCGKAYHTYAKLSHSLFEKSQLMSLIKMQGTYLDLSFIFDECITYSWNRLHELKELVDDMRPNVPDIAPFDVTDSSEQYFRRVSNELKELLLYRDFKTSVFQNFREIGNTFAFIRILSEVSDIFEQYRFSACAPFLGLNPSSRVTSLDRRDSNGPNTIDTDALSKTSPLGKTFYDVIAVSHQSPDGNYARDPLTVNSIPNVTFRSINSTSSAANHVFLLHVYIRQMGSCIQEIGLDQEWGGVFLNNGDLENEHSSKEFHKLWSILNFIFNSNELSDYTPADIIDDETALPVKNQDEFGHGFSVCGCLFLHILNQRIKYELLDFNHKVFRANELEAMRKETVRQSVSLHPTAEEHPTHKAHYLSLWSLEKNVQFEISSLLESACPHQTPPFATFSPPRNDL